MLMWIFAKTAAVNSVPLDLKRSWLQQDQPGDWRVVGPEDLAANDRDLAQDNRLLSAYRADDGTRVWIITEWDRSVTTELLPEEY